MDNPYQPPKDAERRDTEALHEGTSLRRQSVLVLVVLTILTVGIYAVVWMAKTTRTVNTRVDRRISRSLLQAAIAMWVVYYTVALIAACASDTSSARDWEAVARITGLAEGLCTLFWVFEIRRCLQALTSARPGMRTWINPVLTFLLQQFYLQHKINVIVAREARPATAPAA